MATYLTALNYGSKCDGPGKKKANYKERGFRAFKSFPLQKIYRVIVKTFSQGHRK